LPARVKLRVLSEPPGADVYRGEERIGVTPLEIDEPRGDAVVKLELSLRGHPDAVVELPASQDGEVLHEFVPRPAPAAPEPPKPAPVRPKKPKRPAPEL
jgi:hypothetical protein